MKPTPDLVLNQAFAKVAFEMGPALPPGYGQGSATLTGVLLLMVGQEFNRAAAIRARENTTMQALFVDVGKQIDGELGQRLMRAGSELDADLNVAALDAKNAELKKVLIDLQVYAETRGMRDLELRILAFLRDAATDRQVFLPAM